MDMYSEKVAAAAELIRKLTGGTEWFSAFDRSTEDTLELFVAAMDVVREECATSEHVLIASQKQWIADRDAEIARLKANLKAAENAAVYMLSKYSERVAELEAQLADVQEDAERWKTLESGSSVLTLRIHNTRPDDRKALVDLERASPSKGESHA